GVEFLPGADGIHYEPPRPEDYDVAILVDCGDFERVGEVIRTEAALIPFIVNIDHHSGNTPFGNVSWVVPSASSTCEMLYDLSTLIPVELDEDIATQLYTGLLTDTGSFRFANTNRKSLEVATRLVEAGAHPARIAQEVFDSASPQRLKLLGRMLTTVAFLAEGQLATAELTELMFSETESSPADSDGFINQMRSVKSVRVAIVFREGKDGTIYVSMRSKNNVDVSAIALKYGGGGHRQAAACRIEGTIEAVRAQITQEALTLLR
ncbi:MAG: DHH family phosphoesterase, partial [Acidobacteriota bacterium]